MYDYFTILSPFQYSSLKEVVLISLLSKSQKQLHLAIIENKKGTK